SPLPTGPVTSFVRIPSAEAPLVTCVKLGPGKTVSLGYGVRPSHGETHGDGHVVFKIYEDGGGRMKEIGVVRDKEDDVNIGMGVGEGRRMGWAYGTKRGEVRVWTGGDEGGECDDRG
ncbi:hypothetical protein TrRE_jg2729, partial [Triparma retinervis]